MFSMQCIKTVPGLENVKIVRNAYAIEYDCIEYGQLLPNLEFKKIKDYSVQDV